MKKVFICLIAIVFLASCTASHKEEIISDDGVWISCYELSDMLEDGEGFKTEFLQVIKNCEKLNIKNLYIHTRAFGETLYKSSCFPILNACKKLEYDALEYIVKECHKAGISVHAWINPYRIASNEAIEELNAESPAYKWFKEGKHENIGICNGIYLNPSSIEVRSLILAEIKELLQNYKVDGIHFDDYFYPTQNADFDEASYDEYKNSALYPLSVDNWRRENVNLLVNSVYDTVKYANGDIIFSISPAASIENNFNNLYADVALWISEGWVDEIIPQLYFGFEYPDDAFKFENLLAQWKELTEQNSNVTLKIGLACYKAIPTLEPDKPEWESSGNLIASQKAVCDNETDVAGCVYFSYSSLFGKKNEYKTQLQNLMEYLKREKNNE